MSRRSVPASFPLGVTGFPIRLLGRFPILLSLDSRYSSAVELFSAFAFSDLFRRKLASTSTASQVSGRAFFDSGSLFIGMPC